MRRTTGMGSRAAWAVLLVLFGLAGVPALGAGSEPESRVDINRADPEQLMTLPGVGASIAERIIEYREEHGPFRRVEDLMNVRGIGEKSFLKLKDRITVGKEGAKKS